MKNFIETKTCRTCKETKPIIEFHKRKDGKAGTRSSCVDCTRKKNLEYYHNKGGKELQADRSYKHNLKKYGLTEEDYNGLLEDQQGRCAICRSDESHRTERRYNLFVDHCHSTGKVRGLLCHHCNVGLGHFKDQQDLLTKAIEYLNENSS